MATITRPASSRRSLSRRTWTRRQSEAVSGWAFSSPAVILIGVFGLLPVGWSVLLSFQQNDLQTPGEWIGFDNYRKLASDPLVRDSLQHTVIYTALFVPITLVLSLLAAAALNRRIRGITVYRLAVFMPVVTSTIATAVIFTWLMDPHYGLLNYGLGRLGVPPIDWLGDPSWAMPAIILLAVWKNFGYNMVIFLVGLQSIPEPLYEAARIDGASAWQQFLHITLPTLVPIVTMVNILTIAGYFQLFAEPYVMTQGGPLQSTVSVLYFMYEEGFKWWNLGSASAVAFLLFVLIFGVTAVQLRVSRWQGVA